MLNINFYYTDKNNNAFNFINGSDFILSGIDGLTAADINLATATQALADGDVVQSARANARPIVVYLTTKPETDVESFKRRVLNVIKPKQTGTLHYHHDGRNLTIPATVNKIEMPRFNDQVVLQITFYCAYPFWRDAYYIINTLKNVIGLHHFKMTITAENPLIMGHIQHTITQTINNEGDVAVGLVMELLANDNIDVPKITRESDGAFMEFNINMEAGDVLKIDTNRGNKSAKLIKPNGTYYVLNKLTSASTWLQLETGENAFYATSANDSTDMYLSLTYKRAFV